MNITDALTAHIWILDWGTAHLKRWKGESQVFFQRKVLENCKPYGSNHILQLLTLRAFSPRPQESSSWRLWQYLFIHEARSLHVPVNAQFPLHGSLSLSSHLLLSAKNTVFYITLHGQVSTVSYLMDITMGVQVFSFSKCPHFLALSASVWRNVPAAGKWIVKGCISFHLFLADSCSESQVFKILLSLQTNKSDCHTFTDTNRRQNSWVRD